MSCMYGDDSGLAYESQRKARAEQRESTTGHSLTDHRLWPEPTSQPELRCKHEVQHGVPLVQWACSQESEMRM